MEPVGEADVRRIPGTSAPCVSEAVPGETIVEKKEELVRAAAVDRGGGCRNVRRMPTARSIVTPGVETSFSRRRSTKLLRAACGHTSPLSRGRKALVEANVISHWRIHSREPNRPVPSETGEAEGLDPSGAARDPACDAPFHPRGIRDHVFGFDHRRGPLHQFRTAGVFGNPVHEQRRQLMQTRPRNFDICPIHHRLLLPSNDLAKQDNNYCSLYNMNVGTLFIKLVMQGISFAYRAQR